MAASFWSPAIRVNPWFERERPGTDDKYRHVAGNLYQLHGQFGPHFQLTHWTPWPSQKAFYERLAAGADVIGFSGPVGTGKSKALAYAGLQLALINAGCVGLIGAPTYPMLRDVTRLHFIEVLEEENIPYTIHKSENRIRIIPTHSDVLFRSLNNYERLRGTTLAWYGIDELTYCREAAWNRLLGRVRDPKARRRCRFGVWTPAGFDWVWRKFISEEHKLEGYDVVRAQPGENLAVLEAQPSFYEDLRGAYDERFFRQEALGEYLPVHSGSVYHAWDPANLKQLEFRPELPLCWSLDFNVNPLCSVLAQRVPVLGDPSEELVNVLDEIALFNAVTLDACAEFEKRTERFRTRSGQLSVVLYGDRGGASRSTQSDRTDWQIVDSFFRDRAHRFSVQSRVGDVNPRVKARVNAVNARLCNAQGIRRLFVDRRCQELRADFDQVVWVMDKHGNALPEIDKTQDWRRTHVSDALGYLIEREYGLMPKGKFGSTYIS